MAEFTLPHRLPFTPFERQVLPLSAPSSLSTIGRCNIFVSFGVMKCLACRSLLLLTGLGFVVLPGFGQVRRAFELARLAYQVGRSNPDSSLTLGRAALALAQKADSPLEEARARSVLGRTAIFKSDLRLLEEQVTKGLPLVRFFSNDTIFCELFNLAALNWRFKHQSDSALHWIRLAETFARRARLATPQLANALTTKAQLLLDKRLYAEALESFHECYEINRAAGDAIGQGMTLQSMGETLFRLNRIDAAVQNFKLARDIQQKHDDKYGLVRSLSSLGSVYGEKGLWDSAATTWTRAYILAGQLGEPLSQGSIAGNLAVFYEMRKDYRRSRNWGRLSVKHYFATGDSSQAASALGNLGNVECKSGNLKGAEEKLETAVDLAERLGDARILADNLRMLADVYLQEGKAAESMPLYWQFATLQDSLYKQNLAEEVASLQARIELSIKDQRIDSLRSEARIGSLKLEKASLLMQRWSLVAILVVLLLIAVFSFFYLRAKRIRLAMEAKLWEEKAKSSQEALKAEERERRRIAQELHDSLGQMLASIRMQLSSRVSGEDRFSDLIALLAESSEEVRYISHNLIPQDFSAKGFDEAVKELCDRANRSDKLRVIPHVMPIGDALTPEAALVLYRSLQELINNVYKHSGATQVYISVVMAEDEVVLTVEDDGVGFDLSLLAHAEGLGLRAMKERLHGMGGSLEVESQVGSGATFFVTMPGKS